MSATLIQQTSTIFCTHLRSMLCLAQPLFKLSCSQSTAFASSVSCERLHWRYTNPALRDLPRLDRRGSRRTCSQRTRSPRSSRSPRPSIYLCAQLRTAFCEHFRENKSCRACCKTTILFCKIGFGTAEKEPSQNLAHSEKIGKHFGRYRSEHAFFLCENALHRRCPTGAAPGFAGTTSGAPRIRAPCREYSQM